MFVLKCRYDLKVECGAAFNRHKSKTPDACFFFADNIVVIDHHYDDVYILSLHEGSTATPAWLDETEKRLLGLKASDTNKSEVAMSLTATLSPSEAGFLADKSKEQYMKDVKQCLQFIKDGESYELCLTSQLRKRIGEMDLLGFYLHLREKNPAPFAAWLNFPKEKLCICSSSPERFLKLDENGMLEAKPIKGTVPRGSAKEADEQLKQKLQCRYGLNFFSFLLSVFFYTNLYPVSHNARNSHGNVQKLKNSNNIGAKVATVCYVWLQKIKRKKKENVKNLLMSSYLIIYIYINSNIIYTFSNYLIFILMI